jgi:uncharacterized protein (DUF302 family)
MNFLAEQSGARISTEEVIVRKFRVISSKPFDDVLSDLTGTIGRPEMTGFLKAAGAARTRGELESVVQRAIGASGLMEFLRLDAGDAVRSEGGPEGSRILRLLVGNPLIMSQMARHVPDAAAYAPVTILVVEGSDGVRLSYDTMASLLSAYGSQEALKVAEDLDAKVEGLMTAAAS